MSIFKVYPLFDVEPVQGRGSYVYDKHGTPYLDVYGGHAVISIGHSHPHQVNRMRQQLESLMFYSNSVQNSLLEEVGAKLTRLSQCEQYALFMCNSGAEAVENAIKMASFGNGRKKVVALSGCYHGRTSAAINITDDAQIQAPINQTFDVVYIDVNDTETLTSCVSRGDFCAVIVETIQGIGGLNTCSDDFLRTAREVCDSTGTYLVADEIQSGFGRTGEFFAFQHSGIEPDLITMAKGMGNGFPVGGVLIHQDKFSARHGLLGATFGGNHLGCTAVLSVLDVIEQEGLMDHSRHMGEYLGEGLASLPDVVEVKGRGLMRGITMPYPVKDLRNHLLYEKHVFTGSSNNPDVLRLLPPLTIAKQEIDGLIDALRASIQAMPNRASLLQHMTS